jgi:Domain of unknown function (DUF4304)
MGIFDFLKKKPKLIEEKSENIVLPNKEELKTNLDNIQNEIFQFLKPLGFKKKGRTFNRQTEDGIYQIINIQSGLVYSTLYGSFTINLGIMVKEIYELESYHKPKDFYLEYECNIRKRLSNLINKNDLWWSISENIENTAKEIIEGIRVKGIEWLSALETREEIINNWVNMADSNSPRAKLDVAIIALTLDREKGSKLIKDYYHKIKSKSPHKDYVKELAEKLGVKLI